MTSIEGDNSQQGGRASAVRDQQVHLLYQQLYPALAATVLNSTIMAVVMWETIGHRTVLLWMGVMLLLVVARIGLALAYRRGHKKPDDRTPWEGLFLLGVALSGCVWGSAAVFLFPAGSPPHQAFLAMILSGMCASAVASLGAILPAFLLFLFPAIVPIAVQLFRVGETASTGMAVLATAFVLMLSMVAKQYNSTLTSSLELRFANNELIESLSEARRKAEAASHAKTQFLANMSHEIRTPMNGVLGMLELLQGTPLDGKQLHFAGTAHRSGVALLHVINDVLDFSKIESGNLTLEKTEFNLRDVVEDTVEFLAERAHRKQLELTSFIDDDLPTAAIGDPHRLRQILTNLIANAIKFTEEGEVSVDVSRRTAADGKVGVRVEVRDTGIGIPQEVQEQIFESFVQADSATTRQYGGTGLGLAITRQLVDMQNGTIGVESTPGEGATFWFELVLSESTRSSKSKRDPQVMAQQLRALIVDDNATNRSILEHQLEGFLIENESVADGPRALESLLAAAVTNKQFDFAVLDMNMPGMDGLQLARAIRSQPVLDKLRLLMLTSVGQFGDAQAAHQVGIQIYLTKPVRQSHLYEAILELTQDHRQLTVQPPQHEAERSLQFDRRVRVLLAEDHRVNLQVAVAMLDGFGCEVVVAHDGKEAVATAQSAQFDIILMDCQMPKLDGFGAARILTGTPTPDDLSSAPAAPEDRSTVDPPPPIIALTAHATEGDRERCLAAGMSDYLSKPFARQELFQVIAEHLPKTGTEPVLRHQDPHQRTAGGATGTDAPIHLLDERALEAIREVQSEQHPDLLAQVIGFYIEDTPRLIDSMTDAASSGRADELRQAAHTLKSSSANLGAQELAEFCRVIEDHAKSGQVDAAQDQVREAERLHQLVQRELQRRLQEL